VRASFFTVPTHQPPNPYIWAQTSPYLHLRADPETATADQDRRTRDLDFLILFFILVGVMMVLTLLMVCIIWALMAFCSSWGDGVKAGEVAADVLSSDVNMSAW